MALAAAAPPPLIAHDCEFGEAYAFSSVECMARLENAGDQAFTVRVAPEPSDPDVPVVNVMVPAKGSAPVPLRANLGNAVNRTVKFFTVEAQGLDLKSLNVQARGFVMNALDEAHPSLDFGSVDVAKPTALSISLSSRETAHFRITRVLHKPAGLDVYILPDGHTMQARVRSDAPWGVLDGFIKLGIDTPRQKEAWVALKGEIHGPVVPAYNPGWFGILSAGREQMVQVHEIRRQDGKPLHARVGKLEGMQGTASLAACTPAADSCQVLRLTIPASQPAGMQHGTVSIDLPDFARSLTLGIQGLLLEPENGEAAETANSAASGLVLAKPQGGDDGTDVASRDAVDDAVGEKATPKPEATEPPPGRGPLLKWAAKDERSVHGYQVYRADAEAGPYVLLNSPTIPAHSRGESGSTYQWRDTSAVKGNTYWYYVGVVYNDGRKEKITPEMKALAK